MRIFASRHAPMRADYARASYAVQVRRAWQRVTFAVGEASCLVFVVSKPRWPRCAVVPDLHLHRPSSSVSECVKLCDALWPIRTYSQFQLRLNNRPSVSHCVIVFMRNLYHRDVQFT